MTAIKYYYTSYKNESLKLKHTFASWLTLICTALIPMLFFTVYLVKWASLSPEPGVNPWEQFTNEQIRNTLAGLVPMFIVLITSLIIQLEHKSLALKQVFTMPVPKWSVYFGKLSVIISLVFITYIFYYLLILFNGTILGWLRPSLKFSEFSPDYLYHIKVLFRSFLSVLAILALQFWLSFRFKNFIIPLGIGMVLVMVGLIAAQAEEAIYFPYSYSILGIQPIDEGIADPEKFIWLPKIALYSLVYFVFFSVLGFLDIRRMNIK